MNEEREADGRPQPNLAARVTAAAAWMVGLRWIDRAIGLVSLAILARLLLPQDFGVVGYAMLMIGIIDLFTGFSTDAELIRHQLADRAYYSAAWTINLLRGLAIGILMLVLMHPAASFFGEPRLTGIMAALAIAPLIAGFENVGIVEFRKHLDFDREFRFLLATRVLGTLATLALAYVLRNYWALVMGSLARSVFRVALSYAMHPFRPVPTLSRAHEIFRFSRWIMLQNLAQGANERLPGFVIGHQWDSSAFAFFNMGKELADLSATEIRAPIRRALYPGIARIAERQERIGTVLVESTGLMALVTLPMPLGIALVADDLVPLFLGPKWVPTVSLLQPLCVAAAVTALGTNSQLAYMALNRVHLAAIAAWARLLLLLALLLAVAPIFGIVGLAYAIAALACIMLIADYTMSSRLLGFDFRRFLANVWRPVMAALAMCAVVWAFRQGFPPPENVSEHAWRLAQSALLGAVVYVAAVMSLWALAGRGDGAERRLLSLARRFLPRARFVR